MKFKIFTFLGSDSNGHFANIFGNSADRDSNMDQCAAEAWDEDVDGEYPADSAWQAWDIVAKRRGETYDADTVTLEATPIVPQDAVQATRAAVEALAFARDCLKAAGADRSADKARLALSSAKGAVRHAEGKAVRK